MMHEHPSIEIQFAHAYMKAIKLSILYVARAIGLFRLCRYLSRSKIRILCYHGGSLADEHLFNSLLFCRAEFLELRLRWLRKHGFSIVPLDAAVLMLDSSSPRPRLPTVLTFDDGWFSTFRCLHPVVARYHAPATLYLCTSYFAAGRPNLDVTVNYILWKAGNRKVVFDNYDSTLNGPHDLSVSSEKGHLACAMVRWLLRQELDREGVCAELSRFASLLGVSTDELKLESRRFDFVNKADIFQLAAEGWSIELHGHLHQYPAGRPGELEADLENCRTEISKAGLPAARHYCYPSGNHDAEAHRLLKSFGVISATTCLPGLIDTADDRNKFYLCRFLDGEDIHPLEFESEMSGFSDWLRRVASLRGRFHSREPVS